MTKEQKELDETIRYSTFIDHIMDSIKDEEELIHWSLSRFKNKEGKVIVNKNNKTEIYNEKGIKIGSQG